MQLPVVVIGAGAAGLAVAAELKSAGIPVVVLERHDGIGGLWNRCNPHSPAYDSLTTNSSKATTYLDEAAPASWPQYFSRQRALDYLEDFAVRHGLAGSIRCRCDVRAVGYLDAGRWEVCYTDGRGMQCLETTAVVLCSGAFQRDNRYVPEDLKRALDDAGIGYVHSSDYRNSAPYRDKRVLVVGLGNSGADIAAEISQVAKETTVSVRTVPWIVPLWVLGLPADRLPAMSHGFKIPFGLQNRAFRLLQRLYIGHPKRFGLGDVGHDLLDRLPVSDHGIVEAIDRGRVRLRGTVRQVDRGSIRFDDDGPGGGAVDRVVLATGYRRRYPMLDRRLAEPLLDEQQAFPLLLFHPQAKNLFVVSEVNVPQGSWPLFAKQARAISAYLQADRRHGNRVREFDREHGFSDGDFKGNLFRGADRFHVDPRIYGAALDRFADWIQG